MFQRLLFCTDLSDSVDHLTRFVSSLAASGAKQIIFLHCVPFEGGEIPRIDETRIEAARQRLSVALQSIPDGVRVNVEVESGRPSDVILRTAKQYQVDLILLGMPIASFLKEKLFGSTTVALCQRTTVPLMILRPQLLATYTSEELNLRCQHLFRYVLIPYDGTDSAKHLVGEIKKQAQKDSARGLEVCHLCWVVEDVGRRGVPSEYYVEPARKALIEVKAELEASGLQVKAEVRQGEPTVELLEIAGINDVTAIATTSKSLGKLQEWSVPSFTRELLHRSWHPIIYFPQLR